MYNQQPGYDQGHGMYNSTARSFYNVNPVFNPEDNGRASPQFPTQHVPIYNPAMTTEHMYTQAQASRDMMNQGGIVNYATRGMHAENYSLLESQARAKKYSNVMGGLSTVSTVLGVVGGVAASTGVGLGIGAGAMYLTNKLDSYQKYYDNYSDRMGRLSGIKSTFAGNYNIVNPATGVMSGQDANKFADMMSNSAAGTGFSEQDMYSIHTMANRSGLMQGHTGSLGKASARISALAKMTKQIMDMGEGIDQGTAMEIQRLSQTMEIDLNKFQGRAISQKLLSAANLTNKTIAATTAVLEANASQSAQLGLGGAAGVESTLYHSRFAAPQFGHLSAKQQAAVGGSQDAYVQNLVGAQLNFASRNASTLAMGAYYLDPTSGQFKIDTNEVYAMAHGGFDPNKEYKRGMQLLNKDNRKRLKTAGINQNLVSNLLQENLGRLGKEAMGEVSSDLQTSMSIQEIVRTAADNNMSFNQAAGQLGYSKEQVASLQTFANNYGKGGARIEEEDRLGYARELQSKIQNAQFVTSSQRRANPGAQAAKRQASLDATLDSMSADRAREESVGVYGGRKRTFTDDQIMGVLTGKYDNITSNDVGVNNLFLDRSSTGFGGYGVNLNLREQDVQKGFMADLLGYGGHQRDIFGNARSIRETAAGKEVLAKLYATDFYGQGSDVSNENIFGVDKSIMGRLAQGSYVSTDDLNSTFNARDTITSALQEVYGKTRGGAGLETLISHVGNESIRETLGTLAKNKGDLTSEQSQTLSEALSSLAVQESAQFSAIGRQVRTSGGRARLRSSVKGDAENRKINRAAKTIRSTIQQAVDSGSDWFANDNTGLGIQTSKRKMAEKIYRDNYGDFENVEEVIDNLDVIIANAYDTGGATVQKALNKSFQIAETSKALLTGGDTLSYAADQLVGTYVTRHKVSGVLERIGQAYNHSIEARIAGRSAFKSHRYELTTMKLSDIVLGVGTDVSDSKDARKLIAEKAMSLTNAVRNVSMKNPNLVSDPGEAQKLTSDLILQAIRYMGANKDIKDADQRLNNFFSENDQYRQVIESLDPEHRNTIINYIKSKSENKDDLKFFNSGDADKMFGDVFEDLMTIGVTEIKSKATVDLVKGSAAVSKFFGKGKTDDKYAESVVNLFKTLKTGFSKDDEKGFITKGGSLDTNSILKALGFDLKGATREDAAELRKMATEHFGGGDFGSESRDKFGQEVYRRIKAGKMKSVGGGSNQNNNDAIQTAITQMATLQQATAQLLTALAKNDKSGLDTVATTLSKLQTPK